MQVFLVLAILCVVDGAKLRLLPGRLSPRYDYYAGCENVSTPFQYKNTSISTIEGNQMVMNADIIVTRFIPKFTSGVFKIQNCLDSSTGHCQLFQTWRNGEEICNLIADKHAFWSPFFYAFKPVLKCPVAEGEMIARNATIDMNMLTKLPYPLEKYFWRVNVQYFDRKLANCFDIHLHFLRLRGN